MNIDSPLQCIFPIESEHTDAKFYLWGMELLLLVVQELSLARSIEDIMKIVSLAARQLTDSDGANFVLRDNGDCYHGEESGENAIAPLCKGQSFSLHQCISCLAMINRQPVVIEDIYQDVRVSQFAASLTCVKSLVMVPIRTIEPIGAIGTYWKKVYQPKTEQIKLLQALADTTAVAMKNVLVNAELDQRVRARTAILEAMNSQLQQEIDKHTAAEAEVRRLCLTDELTGLNNRRGFFFLAEQLLKIVSCKHLLTYLFFIDLDGLKHINDTFGHEMGDTAIISTANILKTTFREPDIIARLGGDEFVIIIQATPRDCDILQKKLQIALNKFNQAQQQPFQLSMSIGIQAYDPTQPIALDYLITLADIKMYQNKRAKRVNC